MTKVKVANPWSALDRGDKVLIASTLASLIVWWLFAGKHKYSAPKGAR